MASKVGTLVLIKVATKLVVGQSEMSFSSTRDMIETSNKLTGIHASYEYGRMKNTISVSGICGTSAEGTNEGFWELYAAQLAGTKVTVTFSEHTSEAGTTPTPSAAMITSTCLISKLDASFPDSKENKFSCELTVDGASVVTANA